MGDILTAAPRHVGPKQRKRRGLVAAAVVVLVTVAVFAWPGSPVKDAAISIAKYRECFSPGGDGPATVGLGDSITKGHSLGWMGAGDSYYDVMACDGAFSYAGNAGVWQQTTAQILARVDSDVISKHPARVLVLAGTNDVRQGIAGESVANLSAMRDKFKAAGITAYFGLIPPSNDKPQETALFNASLKQWADREGVQLIDYWTPLADPDGTYKDGFTADKIHPTPAGARIMADTAEKVLR